MGPFETASLLVLSGSLLVADALRLARHRGGSGEEVNLAEIPSDSPLPYLPALDLQPATPPELPRESAPAAAAPPPAPFTGAEPPSAPGQTTIVTHGDFDGIASAALLLRGFGDDADLRFTTPRKLPWMLPRLTTQSSPGDRLIVADLGLDEGSAPPVLEAVEACAGRGVEIWWYDHHHWPAAAAERLRSVAREMVLDPRERTAAALIHQARLPQDGDAARLVAALQSPKGSVEWADQVRGLMAGAITTRDPETLKDVAVRLSAGGELELGWSDRLLLRKARQTDRITREMARLEHRRETTARGRAFLVVDARPYRWELDPRGRRLWVVGARPPSGFVAREACRLTGTSFALILWRNHRYSLSREGKEVDFRSLFHITRLADTPARIAGHGYAAGITVTPTPGSRLRSLFDWRPPAPAEALIQQLKEHL